MSAGYQASNNRMGFRAVRLHYSADEERDIHHPDPEIAARAERWLERTRANYPDPNQWAQEMEVNWWVAQGVRVFPQFVEHRHAPTLAGYRARKVIYRAIDFGWLTPACLIAQIDSKDRLVILKEIVGFHQTTREFGKEVIDRCVEWFPHHTPGYTDFCDPAGQQASSTASERNESRDVEILNALKIYPKWEYGWSRKDGRSLIHQLLAIRVDDTPGLLVNAPDCPVLMQGFLGKYVYPAKKGTGAAHEEPDETNHPWADVMACLRYLATGLYSALGLRRQKKDPAGVSPYQPYMGYGTPVKPGQRPLGASRGFVSGQGVRGSTKSWDERW
jgi:hypothetical protein